MKNYSISLVTKRRFSFKGITRVFFDNKKLFNRITIKMTKAETIVNIGLFKEYRFTKINYRYIKHNFIIFVMQNKNPTLYINGIKEELK